MKVLAFGEILWDIIEGKSYLGGAPFNFAAHVVKCGGKASILSAVGNDDLGHAAVQQAGSLGVDTSLINISHHRPTGTVDVFLDNGQPDYTIHEQVAFDEIKIPEIRKIQDQNFDVFYFGALAQRNVVSAQSLRQILEQIRFKEIFFDINIRKQFYTKEIIDQALQHATIFKINDQEVELVSELFFGEKLGMESFTKKISANYPVKILVITAGEKGCFIYAGNSLVAVPGVPVKVVDAVGAGDAFSAAFLTGFLNSGDVQKSAVTANQVGAFVASSSGAIPEYSAEIVACFK
jgi:fructokinase